LYFEINFILITEILVESIIFFSTEDEKGCP